MSASSSVARTASAIVLMAVACALPPAAADAAARSARVVRVLDGDSVRLKAQRTTRTYALRGVRAPAAGECHARASRRQLRRLLPRGARVKVSGRGRSVDVRRGSRLVNKLMVRRGHAFARGSRWRSQEAAARAGARGMWKSCQGEAEMPSSPQPGSPGTPSAPDKQAMIAELDRLLQGAGVYTTRTSGSTTDERTAHLCPNHRFLYRSATLIVDSGGSFNSSSTSAGTWRVVDALVDPSGIRQAIVETTADQGDAAGETARTFLQIDPDLTSGRWDDQAARFFRSDQC